MTIDYAGLYRMASERFIDLGSGTLRLASEGKWSELVDLAANYLSHVDAVEEGDQAIWAKAKKQARAAEAK